LGEDLKSIATAREVSIGMESTHCRSPEKDGFPDAEKALILTRLGGRQQVQSKREFGQLK
jgi:hypothetical protein